MKAKDILKINDKKYSLGKGGEAYVLEILKLRGFTLYEKNIKRWGFEVDMVVYKWHVNTSTIEIRLVEVKTRSGTGFTSMEDFGIKQKIMRYRKSVPIIGEGLVSGLVASGVFTPKVRVCRKYHFDLAVVGTQGSNYYLKKYIQNVNLLI